MRFIKANLSALLVISTGLITIILLLIFPAAIHDGHDQTGDYWVKSVNFWGFIFGYMHTIATQYPINGTPFVYGTSMYDGGISIFGLVFFIFLVLSLILVILSIFTKKKILEIIGSILMILSGICIFLLLEVGTNIIRGKYD